MVLLGKNSICQIFVIHKISVNNERKKDIQNHNYGRVSSCCSFAALHFFRLYLSSTISCSLVAVVLIFGFAQGGYKTSYKRPGFALGSFSASYS